MSFHDLSFSRSLVVDSAKVKHPVHYHTEQLSAVALPRRLGIRAHRIERNQHVAAYPARRRIVKRYNVGIIVMAEKFPVGANYLIIAAETITDIADFPRMSCGLLNN